MSQKSNRSQLGATVRRTITALHDEELLSLSWSAFFYPLSITVVLEGLMQR